MRVFSVIFDDGRCQDKADGHYASIESALQNSIEAAALICAETAGAAYGEHTILCIVEDVASGEQRSVSINVGVVPVSGIRH
ncbi:hypothetical protein [Sphingomonas beigongshangi]|nr:hypothetical protein [Sphingomonas beigongshangi]